jgi:glutamine amidotransferase
MKISLINSNGNLKSFINSLNKINFNKINIIENENDVINSDLIIFPGVGSFETGIKSLHKNKIFYPLIEHIKKGKPYLGVCLGMQILFSTSDESKNSKGLNIFEDKILKIKTENNDNKFVKKLNVGWRKVNFNKNKIIEKIFPNNNDNYFYFMHGFFLKKQKSEFDEYEIINYGNNKIVSYFVNKNIFAFQFHLERSGLEGLELLKSIILYLKNNYK